MRENFMGLLIFFVNIEKSSFVMFLKRDWETPDAMFLKWKITDITKLSVSMQSKT